MSRRRSPEGSSASRRCPTSSNSRCMSERKTKTVETGCSMPLGWQEFLVDFSDNYIIRVDHFGQVDSRNLRKQFVGIHLREAIIRVNPFDELREGDTHTVV